MVGLLIALLIAAAMKLARASARAANSTCSFYSCCSKAWLVYLGVLAGTIFGLCWIHDPAKGWDDPLLLPVIGGGAVLGVVFCVIRQIRRKLERLTYCLVMGAVVAGGLLFWLGQFGDYGQKHHLLNETVFATQILAGMALFYVLTFAGREDETEVESAASAPASPSASASIAAPSCRRKPGTRRLFVFLVPAVLFLAYALRVLPWLRVVKHSFRGLSFARFGRYRRSLQSFRCALQLDPQNKLARQGLWDVHRSLDLNAVADDPQTLALVDLDLCLDRAGSLLVQGKPTPAQLEEAHRLLDLVLKLRPGLQPAVDYSAVAHTHARQYDEAAAELARLLDPAHYGRDNPQRQSVLLVAWQMALTLSDELRRASASPSWLNPAGAWRPSPWWNAAWPRTAPTRRRMG